MLAKEDDIHKRFSTQCTVTPLPAVPQHALLLPQSARTVHKCESLPNAEDILVDLTPRPIMAAGALVDLLVRTNVGHYLDFRPVDGLYLQFDSSVGIQRVPASRADVFQHTYVTVIEKRRLTRFIKRCIELSEESAAESAESAGLAQLPETSSTPTPESSFHTFMAEMSLSEKLQRFILHSVLFCAPGAPLTFAEGRSRVRLFHDSLMRFGTQTPFLYPNYGTGELAQAFCRLCAVHGGTYVLRRGVAAILQDDTEADLPESEPDKPTNNKHNVGVVSTTGDIVSARHVYIGREFFADENVEQDNAWKVWRFIGIVDGSVVRDGQRNRIMITVPRAMVGNNGAAVRWRQVDHTVCVCPPSTFLVYAETTEKGGGEEDVLACATHYLCMEDSNFDDGSINGVENGVSGRPEISSSEANGDGRFDAVRKPKLLWGMTYSRMEGVQSKGWGRGVNMVHAPEVEHDADGVVAEAERCFRVMYPDRPFFPDRREEEEEVENDKTLDGHEENE